MAKFIKGDVVVIPFPFSDLSVIKRRPALIITSLKGNDLILCQITSQTVKDDYAVQITDNDFEQGSLKQVSNVRPNRIFTAENKIILYKIGKLNTHKLNEIIKRVIDIIQH
ncbi:MAG: type II toxin-antitoxin system PemK/MazF family toxin [Ignavibacteria bacterium]|nr:type II toxin-antitoxin system PemK/MazF family toxin [Ignavibacteria bacterium]